MASGLHTCTRMYPPSTCAYTTGLCGGGRDLRVPSCSLHSHMTSNCGQHPCHVVCTKLSFTLLYPTLLSQQFQLRVKRTRSLHSFSVQEAGRVCAFVVEGFPSLPVGLKGRDAVLKGESVPCSPLLGMGCRAMHVAGKFSVLPSLQPFLPKLSSREVTLHQRPLKIDSASDTGRESIGKDRASSALSRF